MSHTSDLSQRAKDHASDLGAQAKATATQEAAAHADQAKHNAATKAQKVANAADAAARELDPTSARAQAVQHVADHIEDVATKLRTADVRELAGQATDMARRNPFLFMGGAAIAGFAAARFLKAREPQPAHDAQASDPWATPNPVSRGAATDSSVLSQINGERTHG